MMKAALTTLQPASATPAMPGRVAPYLNGKA